jgi:hypothetical protein
MNENTKKIYIFIDYISFSSNKLTLIKIFLTALFYLLVEKSFVLYNKLCLGVIKKT